MKSPKISVVLACFDAEKYLEKALNSLLIQTLSEIEIICVDDGSTDKSLGILQKFAKKDKRIKVYETDNKKFSSPSVARNLGLEKATAPFVMFCDGDDYAEPTFCEKMYQAIHESDADLAVFELNVVYEAHREMKVSDDYYYALKYSGTRVVTPDIILNVDSAPTNKIFRKSLLDKYKIRFPEGTYYEDAYFCSAYFFASKKVTFVNERLYNYVRHTQSIMSQTWSKDAETDFAIDHLVVAEKLYEFLEKNNLRESHNEVFWQLFAGYARFAIVNSKTKKRQSEVRQRATEFIKEHGESFERATAATQEEVKRFCSAKVDFNMVTMKKALIKLMPTYRLATENIHKLRTLKNRQADVTRKFNKLQKNGTK